MGIFIATTAGLAIFLSFIWIKKKENKKKALLKENIPENLGLLQNVPAGKIKSKLERSLSYEYLNQVKLRFLSEHPDITEDEYEWRLFELKRYFLMNSILKNTPMFSAEVDEIWHEMLMFTRQYETFSDRYMGKMLHHTPNLNPEPAPQDRAMFDWLFAQLFEITEYSWKTWGAFFQYPLSQDFLKNIRSLNEEEIKQRYFSVNEENEELISYLLQRLKNQLRASEDMYSTHRKGKFSRPSNYGDLSSLTMVMVFYSYYYFDEYWIHVKEYAYSQQAQGTSGCSAVFCGSGGNHDSNDGNGCSSGNSCSGHSCSSSSCSSCGGGCSS